MPILLIEGYVCTRCKHKWFGRKKNKEIPITCPKCNSPYWNKPRLI